jgi:hypothetical protein
VTRKRRSSQEIVDREVSRGLVVFGEICFSDSPDVETFKDYKWGGCSASVDNDGTSFVLKVFTPDPIVRDFYRNANGNRKYSVFASEESVALMCSAGGQKMSVGVFSELAASSIRRERIWSKLVTGRATVVRTGRSSIGCSMPLDKWNELMQGADLVEVMTDEEVMSLLCDVEETLDAEVYVTEVEIRVDKNAG